jgi:DNA-directed RNA polymerase subunit RPC12/RpoP
MEKVKCLKCDHEWETKSKMIYVTCPSCQLKVKNKKNKGKQKWKQKIRLMERHQK